MTLAPAAWLRSPTIWRRKRPWWATILRSRLPTLRQASQEQESSAASSRCRLRKAAKASSRASSRAAGGPTARSGPTAKTASPSTSWISRGGESRCMTSPSSSAMIGGPCSSSVAVTNAVKPEISARTSMPSSV
jgi:hypothetical protein